jgi:cytochrome c-type biogenesis protein CcmH/NrfG
MTSDPPTEPTPHDGDVAPVGGAAATPSRRRKVFIVGGLAVGVIALAIAAFAINDSSASTTDAAGAALTDDELSQLDSLLGDLPDQPSRLERGRQLMEAGDYAAALDQYLAVLDDGPNAEALAFVGWITHVSGDPALAQHLLEQSLVLEPGDLTATWFLANVKFYGTEDVAGAVPLLEQVVGRADAEPDMIAAAEAMLAVAGDSTTPPSETQPTSP